jgi:hypothetical protein
VIRLQALGGALTLTHAVSTTAGSISLLAQGDVIQGAASIVSNLGGSIDVESFGGQVSQADGALMTTVNSGGNQAGNIAAASTDPFRLHSSSSSRLRAAVRPRGGQPVGQPDARGQRC